MNIQSARPHPSSSGGAARTSATAKGSAGTAGATSAPAGFARQLKEAQTQTQTDIAPAASSVKHGATPTAASGVARPTTPTSALAPSAAPSPLPRSTASTSTSALTTTATQAQAAPEATQASGGRPPVEPENVA